MAAPAYATDLTDITTSFTTNWNLISEGGGGQNALTAPETDDFIQGTESVSRNPFSSSIRGVAYDRALITVATDDAVYHWWKADVAQALDSFANGGVHLIQGSSLTAYKKFYVAGNDTYQLGGWRCTPIDPTATSSLDRGTPGTPDYDTFGVAFDVPASGPSKGFPFKADMIRHGRSVDVTAGEVADPATWDKLSAYADATTRRWGIVQGTDTGAAVQGIVNWGTVSAAVYSRDSGRAIVFTDTLGFVVTDFTQVLFDNDTTDIEWTGMTFTALGTLNRGLFNSDTAADPIVIIRSTVFNDIDTFDAGTNTELRDCTFNRTNEVTITGGSIVGSSFLESTVAADSAAVIYNETADPDGEFDNTTFSKGTASHHAIEFGTSAPTTMTLRGIDFSGFSGTGTAATLNFLRTSGTTTVNLIGCTGTITAQVTGTHTVTFVTNPVTLTVKCVDAEDSSNVQGARVFLEASDGTGDLPFEDSVSITRSGSTATVTHTAHGLSTNDWIVIRGASQEEYNVAKQITVTGVNSYTFTVTGTPATPATGSPVASGVLINALTSAAGEVTFTKSLSVDQPYTGWARRGSTSPIYAQSPIVGTLPNDESPTIPIALVSDE